MVISNENLNPRSQCLWGPRHTAWPSNWRNIKWNQTAKSSNSRGSFSICLNPNQLMFFSLRNPTLTYGKKESNCRLPRRSFRQHTVSLLVGTSYFPEESSVYNYQIWSWCEVLGSRFKSCFKWFFFSPRCLQSWTAFTRTCQTKTQGICSPQRLLRTPA
jgi:hypothetical protein